MGYEDKIAAHMEKIKPALNPDEEVLMTFYGKYDIKGFGPGKNLRLNGTWCMTDKRMLFTGKAGFSSSWGGMGKSGKIMTIPYGQIVEIWPKKYVIKIKHTAEHEGKKPGATRGVTLTVHQLRQAPDTGKKEDKQSWFARTEMICNKIKELAGIS
ncbi:MAG: PH domain-containing protein [Candidatus Helarchaeota archaeon]|nr:PH domain-containing protein [Candidatus Helarchaeota archaeon]